MNQTTPGAATVSPPPAGHNQAPADETESAKVGREARDHLRNYVQRIEALESEKREIANDIKSIYTEAKANGLNSKTLRQVIAIRKIEASRRREEEHLRQLYLNALGMK